MNPSNYVGDTAYHTLAAVCGTLSTIILKGEVRLDQHGKHIYDNVRPEPAGATRLNEFDEERAEVQECEEVEQDYYCNNV